jgi:putative transcriptional regulator
MSKLGKRLINAAKSAQAIAKGEADPKTYKVHVPTHLDVRAIRTKLKMSQNAFAARFGILPSTLRDWEQNRRHPDGAARVLLMVIDKEPDAVTRALATASRQKQISKKYRPWIGVTTQEWRPVLGGWLALSPRLPAGDGAVRDRSLVSGAAIKRLGGIS